MCCEAVSAVFRDDVKGDVTLDLVHRIAQLIKKRVASIKPMVIETFLTLKMIDGVKINPFMSNKEKQLSSQQESGEANKQKYQTKSQRKRTKADKILEKEFKEARANFTEHEVMRMQTSILDSVFTVYFRILKNLPSSNLFSAVLKGVMRYAHQINVEFMTDLLHLLTAIMESTPSPLVAMQCAQCAFQALKLQGFVLEVDLATFYHLVYDALWSLTEWSPHQGDLAVAAAAVLRLMLCEQKQLPIDRIAAFVKRILIVAACQPPMYADHLLAVVATLMQLHPKLTALLSAEQTSGVGNYLWDQEQPDYCNPWSTQLWELSLLKAHVDTVATAKTVSYIISKQRAPGIPSDTPRRLLFSAPAPEKHPSTSTKCPPLPRTLPTMKKSDKTKTPTPSGLFRSHFVENALHERRVQLEREKAYIAYCVHRLREHAEEKKQQKKKR
eukprot:TRINITY_DN2523_c1_g1_i2.p1 TRINITY_DN2523_c1_g1~~TRINITY_DN2523_c1_g1_i2.p1  ORF type:complete len:442 (+),score=131.64 TRINITY_DN2523_c1_g1_i2:1234-2559(+)